MTETRPIVVVGAGPTGLTAALELSRFGVPIRIVDRLAERSTTSRALAVQARTVELLHQRGVGAEMVRLGNPARTVSLYGDRAKLGTLDLAHVPSRFDFILLLSQAETERLLEERLADQGVRVERGVEAVAFARTPDGVRTVLKDPHGHLEEVDAAFAISAEGAHSAMRETAGLPFAGDAGVQRYALGDLSLDSELPDSEMTIFIGTHGFLAVFPMGTRRFRFISTDPTGAAQHAAGEPSLAELQGRYDAVAHVPARMHDLNWSSRFWINSRHLSTLRSGRVFFGGDAAHIHSPAGGQGMNTGIQDMVNLAWKLALVHGGLADDALLDTYQAERLPVIRQIVSTTERATNALNSPRPLVRHALATAAGALLGLPAVQRMGPKMLSETGTGYHGGPLAGTRSALAGLRSGDRVPDLAETVRVADDPAPAAPYDLLDPTAMTLLLVGEPGPVDLDRRLAGRPVTVRRLELTDAGTDATGLASAPGALLVRPDAYVAAAAPGDDATPVWTWLDRWLPRGR
jgi:2-polyprenyl-6-methoxyphenol hydroxylase-like FAD-dependent oxidoreductase